MDALFGMLTVVWWVVASTVVGVSAGRKGYNSGAWFLGALLLCPLFVILVVVALPHRAAVTD